MTNLKTILIAAAGTGGHVFPALVIAEQARAQGMKVIWLGTEQGLENKVVTQAGFELIRISSSGVLGKSLFKKILGLWNLAVASLQVIRVIKKMKPNTVLAFGGYITVPAGLAAKIKGIPLILHEQNAVMGLSNRLLARFAKTVYLGFPNASKRKNAVFVGNPIRKEILDIQHSPYSDEAEHPLKLLIIGGSRGARVFNQVVPEAMSLVLKEKKINIWHQTGELDYQNVKAAYEHFHIDAKVTAFIENMREAYQWADLMICRAGAMTVAEVSAVGLAAIFVPFPQSTHDHQTANAMSLLEQKAALHLPQAQFSAETLATLLLHLSATDINELARRARSLRKGDVSATILNYINL